MCSQDHCLRLVEYDKTYLEHSWVWLNDPYIRSLIMAPTFSREDQQRFFENLRGRTDYLIWGVEFGGRPIGAAGLKNHRCERAEYWGYIGEKQLWGYGLGRKMMARVETKASAAGFSSLDLKVSAHNSRAVSLYLSTGYEIDMDISSSETLHMKKEIIRCPSR